MRAADKRYKSLAQQLIVESLVDLLMEKPFEDISITEITEHACVARRSFYQNFTGRHDVLRAYINVLFIEFTTLHGSNEERLPTQYVEDFFVFWSRHQDFLLALQRDGMFDFLANYSRSLLSSWSNYHIKQGFGLDLDDREAEYFSVFSTTGLFSLLNSWVAGGMKETPEQLAELFVRFMKMSAPNA